VGELVLRGGRLSFGADALSAERGGADWSCAGTGGDTRVAAGGETSKRAVLTSDPKASGSSGAALAGTLGMDKAAARSEVTLNTGGPLLINVGFRSARSGPLHLLAIHPRDFNMLQH